MSYNPGIYIIFDLETTSLHVNRAFIWQISAKYYNVEFDRFVLPPRGIPPSVTDITGAEVSGSSVYVDNVRKKTVDVHQAISDFINFLRTVSRGQPVYLVAHNCFRFDGKILCRAVEKVGRWQEFCQVVDGFCDSLVAIRSADPSRRQRNMNYKLPDLAEDILGYGSSQGAHSALTDCRILFRLIKALGISKDDILERIKYPDEF